MKMKKTVCNCQCTANNQEFFFSLYHILCWVKIQKFLFKTSTFQYYTLLPCHKRIFWILTVQKLYIHVILLLPNMFYLTVQEPDMRM